LFPTTTHKLLPRSLLQATHEQRSGLGPYEQPQADNDGGGNPVRRATTSGSSSSERSNGLGPTASSGLGE
ncbi:Os03g0582900, partial [Oryza sativa Japonica Group]